MCKDYEQKGFTKFDNVLLCHLYEQQLTGTQFQIVLLLIRETLGYQRDSKKLSVRKIAEKLDRTSFGTISNAIADLIELNILISVEDSRLKNRTRMLAINTNYDEWLARKGHVIHADNGNQNSSQNVTDSIEFKDESVPSQRTRINKEKRKKQSW